MNDTGYKFDRIVIIGAGGVGFHLTAALCRDLRDIPIEVWDDDTFEGGFGAKRLPYPGDRKQKKVDFLRGYILMVMNDEPPKGVARRLTADDVRGQDWRGTLVVDCTDMDVIHRRELWRAIETSGGTLLRVSYDGLGIVVVAPGLPLGGRKGGGYALVPTLGQSYAAAGLGAMAVMKALKTGSLTDLQVSISDKEER